MSLNRLSTCKDTLKIAKVVIFRTCVSVQPIPTGADRPQTTSGAWFSVPTWRTCRSRHERGGIEAREDPFSASCTEAGPSWKSYAPSAGRSLQLLKIGITDSDSCHANALHA